VLENFLSERRTALRRSYHTLNTRGEANARRLAEFFSHNGQGLLPMVDLIEQSRLAVDELIDITGRATIEAVLQLSAEQVAGPRTPGQRRTGPLWHGRQAGRVCLKERKLGVTKPRLRHKRGGEVAIPAYEAMQENGMSARMLDVLMRGISTRQYAEVLSEMASTCGVSKSNVSREAAEASAEALQELLERRFDEIDLLVIYIDGMQFGEHHIISAVGVDGSGHKHVLGMQQGATENAAAVGDLLEQLVARGVDAKAKRLFVIDGAKALRAAINKVFGPQHPVQRCRNHKIRNVCDRLPEEQKEQVKAAMRASYKLEAKEGTARLRKLADWLEQESPAAANSLREGLEECFTINRLGISPSLHRCLATTNVIESPQSGVRMRTRRVCRWRDAAMVERWAAASFLATEKNFRRIIGWKDLWQLEAILGRKRSEDAATIQEVA
jgi:transposase-like protein